MSLRQLRSPIDETSLNRRLCATAGACVPGTTHARRPVTSLHCSPHMLEKLSETDLFQGLTPESLHEVLMAALPLQRLPAGYTLFRQGEPANLCFTLLDGRAHLTRFDLNGHEIVLRVVEPGHALGITALLDAGTYSTAARLAQPAAVLAWTKADIQRLSRRHPLILQNALQIAMERYVELQQDYQRLAFDSVERRLATVLVKLAHASPADQAEDDIVIHESRESLAAMAVTTIFTISRLLTDWERRGIVTLGRGAITIRDLKALFAIAFPDPDGTCWTFGRSEPRR